MKRDDIMPVYQKKKKVIDKNGNEKEVVVKTNDGRSWIFRTYYTDMYGNRKQKKSEAYLTQKEAKEAEREFLTKVSTSDQVDSNINFELVYKEWLNLKQMVLKQTTYYRLEKNLNKNILEFFNQYKLHSIKYNTIINWKENYLKKSNISLRYQNSIIGYFKEIMSYAKDNYNYDSKILPKIQKYRIDNTYANKREAEWNFWTYEEFNSFISVVDDQLYYKIFSFLYFTGLRMGEMIALSWNDVDFKNKTINVDKNFTNKLGTGNYAILDPKTENSIRIVDLDDDLLNLLKNHYLNESKIYHFSKEMFLFGNIKPISPTTLERKLKKYINIAEIKRITPHGFRHSHVSLLIHLECDSRDVATRIGDTVEMVEKTYYHMFPHKKNITINTLNSFKKSKK